jgi:arylsulfatase
MDPFERADHEGIGYWQWRLDRAYMLVPAQAYVGQWLSSFKEFPPRMKPGSFSLEKVMDQLTKETGQGK